MWSVVVLLFSVSAIETAQATGDSDPTTSFPTTSTSSPTTSTSSPTSSTLSPTSSAPVLLFELPSLSITLDVEKQDDALIPFQDKLKEVMENHLEEFYNDKFLTSEVGIPAMVDVNLDSQIIWKELWVEPKEIIDYSQNHEYNDISFVKKYEVQGFSNCKIKFQIDPLTTQYGVKKPLYVSQTLVDLFFLEAFESDHYWDMMHDFLTTPLLQDIISADVTVLDDGFVHPYDENGNLLFESNDDFFGKIVQFDDDGGGTGNTGMSTLMIAASIIIMLFFLTLVLIWIYICVAMRGELLFHLRRRRRVGRSRSREEGSYKDSVSTRSSYSDEDLSSVASIDGDEDEPFAPGGGWASSISANLDAWANSITSIPLRDIDVARKGRKKKKAGKKVVGRPYFRPCQEHSSSLDCITEADNESWCSTVKSGRSRSSARSGSTRTRGASRGGTRRAGDDDDDDGVAAIHEGDEEDSDDDDEERGQASPLLIQQPQQRPQEDQQQQQQQQQKQRQRQRQRQRQQQREKQQQRHVINLIPSEDDGDASPKQDNRRFFEI